MSLIRCPECGNSISDKAEKCPHCGLPSTYFFSLNETSVSTADENVDYKNLQNVLLSFERDYASFFSSEHYISHRDVQRLKETYEKYSSNLENKLIFQYVCNNVSTLRVDTDVLRRFLRQMQTLDADVTTHNKNNYSR